MACDKPCDQCKQSGMPILFTRYAAGYSASKTGMTELGGLVPKGKFEEQTGGVALQTAKYNIRMLRAGYLYVLIDDSPKGPQWHGFAVHPHGYLTRFDVQNPQDARALAACRPREWGADRSMLWVANPQEVKKFNYFFHPDPVGYQHLKSVIEGSLDRFTQRLDVSGWFGGNTDQDHSCKPGAVSTQVMEFAAIGKQAVLEVGNEQFFGLMGANPTQRMYGNFREMREGRRFTGDGIRQESRDMDGNTTVVDSGAPKQGALVASKGSYIAEVEQHSYEEIHAPRLKKMAQYLADNNGAVVACIDPIGIAQELSLHHLTAATDYVKWLKQADAKGVSNLWKQATAVSIGTIEAALGKKALETYDGKTESLDRAAQNLQDGNYTAGAAGGQSMRVAKPGGGHEEVSSKEFNRRRAQEMRDEASARRLDRKLLGVEGSAAARHRIDMFTSRSDIATFLDLHTQQIEARDKLMDSIASDLRAWLEADDFLGKALARYNENAAIDTGDGIRCAGQLRAILEQIASAPKGRQWYGQLELFTPSKKNLVWRVLSLNNAAISAELQSALASLTTPVTPKEVRALLQSAENTHASSQRWSDMNAAISKLSKTLGAADKIGKEIDTLYQQERKAGTGTRGDSFMQIGKAVHDGPTGVLFVALMSWLKRLPATQWEVKIAQAQAVTLAYGLGTSAGAYLKAQQSSGAGEYISDVLKSDLRNAFQSEAVKQAAAMRVSQVQFGLGALALVPTLLNIPNKPNTPRALVEAAGSVAGVIGSYRQLAVDRYNNLAFKAVPDSIPHVDVSKAAGVKISAQAELLELKAGAARYVIAGAVVGVVFDVADGGKAETEQEYWLARAYFTRAATGAASIGGVIFGARYVTAPLWLSRTNLYLAIVSVVLTIAVDALKGDAWANWLGAGPFRKADSKKIPYRNEKEMMDQLAEALGGLS
jgi:hypothetical protein